MKTFKDLVFKKHKVCKGIQASLEIKPNVFISVVAGEGMYSTSRNGVKKAVDKVEDVSSFEVAIFDQDGEFIGDDMVLSWQSREDINNIIEKFS